MQHRADLARSFDRAILGKGNGSGRFSRRKRERRKAVNGARIPVVDGAVWPVQSADGRRRQAKKRSQWRQTRSFSTLKERVDGAVERERSGWLECATVHSSLRQMGSTGVFRFVCVSLLFGAVFPIEWDEGTAEFGIRAMECEDCRENRTEFSSFLHPCRDEMEMVPNGAKCLWNVFPSGAVNMTFLLAPTTFYFAPGEARLQIGQGYKDYFESGDSPAGLLATFDQPVEEFTGVTVMGGHAWVQFQVFVEGGVDLFYLAYISNARGTRLEVPASANDGGLTIIVTNRGADVNIDENAQCFAEHDDFEDDMVSAIVAKRPC
ncbi:unnamed protein product [Darwinula stevensoni]|uniref:Uncharacterized protein n=1 Tax=Darwinula stevensoni TaxID=69355 RepID=A0A7R8XBC8_9CRUS|nr:unnamed protein product [Darwinula stevensoni]CAG0892707.1 unnamed protein product [Darwinula stevensoni]